MYRVLSLAGGGYLGLFTAQFLDLLEDGGEPLGGRFDLIGGTSVGGLIALALASGVSARKISETIQASGSNIFPRRRGSVSRLFGPGHNTDALAEVVDELLKLATLGELNTRVVVPTFALTTGKVRLFRTPHLPSGVVDRPLKLRDIALATAAAPTFYKPHRIGVHDYADGGIAANAPDAIVACDTVAMRWRAADIRMLAVGTTFRSVATIAGPIKDWGILSWLRGQRLLDTLMAAQMDLARQTAMTLLGNEGIIVADPQQANQQAGVLGLDNVTATSTATLKALAEAEYERLQRCHPLELQAFRRHVPAPPFFFR